MQLDGNILLWIQEHVRNAVLTPVMTFITHLGDAMDLDCSCNRIFTCKKDAENRCAHDVFLLGSLIVNNP